MISERSLKQWQGGEREQGKALRESWGHNTFLGWLLLPRDPYKLAGLSVGMTAQSYARLPGKVLKVPSTPWRGKEHRQESAVSLTTLAASVQLPCTWSLSASLQPHVKGKPVGALVPFKFRRGGRWRQWRQPEEKRGDRRSRES